MAKRVSGKSGQSERGAKTKAMIAAMDSHPASKNHEIAAMVTASGIHCTAQDVANLKSRLKKSGSTRGGGVITLQDLKKVRDLAHESGGLRDLESAVQHVETLASKLGGLDRLKRSIAALKEFQE